VHVVCGEGGSVIHEATMLQESCLMIIKITGEAGCGKKVPYEPGSGESSGAGLGVGGIILIVLAVCVVVYLVAGALINWKVRGASSFTEIVPNWSLWSAIPSLVKDGALFVAHGFKKGDWISI
jgi:hypothetical protein